MTDTQESIFTALALFILGLPIGSFLNVVAYRLPRGQTPWSPSRSYCPNCEAPVESRDNIPVLGWILLKGKCRNCGVAFSARYPAFELLTAVLYAACGYKFGWSIELLPAILLVTTLTIVANSDLDMRIVPNQVLFVSLLAGLVAMALAYPDDWVTWVLSAVIAFVVMFLIAFAYPRGMGMGDVKLAGVMGLYLGRNIAPALLFAFLLGSIVGIGVIAKKGSAEGRKTALPFAPFMAAGGVFAIFLGDTVVDWYLNTFTGP